MLVVLVNGLPGSGKTTLSRALGRELNLPVFSKDTIKETLADHLPGEISKEWSRSLGQAATETLWSLLAESPAGAVLEAPWLAHIHHVVAAGLARAGVAPETTHEVWCDVPLALAHARYVERSPSRHPIHRDGAVDATERFARWAEHAEPVGVGTVHRVDTSTSVDVRALAERLRAQGPFAPREAVTG